MRFWAKVYFGAVHVFAGLCLLAVWLDWPHHLHVWFAAGAVWSLLFFFREDWNR